VRRGTYANNFLYQGDDNDADVEGNGRWSGLSVAITALQQHWRHRGLVTTNARNADFWADRQRTWPGCSAGCSAASGRRTNHPRPVGQKPARLLLPLFRLLI